MIYTAEVEGDFVLVVEDDLMLLATTQSVLSDRGYKVVSCSDPEEAIAVCEKHPRARVVLTRVAFQSSQTTGIQLAQRVAQLCGAHAILTDPHDPALLYGLRGFEDYTLLQQPYAPGQILAAVEEAWANSRRRRSAGWKPDDEGPPQDPGPDGAGWFDWRSQPAPMLSQTR
jgi:CheY-like chemotaxis protein